ncbi:SDR family oxidoreductase [Hwanghaeella grinnelliae]|uniref:SDR family oxidoreductase n=1 Tax=Hwanghaeella grinnelliae TaxID=2500179 RepID=A0A437QUA7_9PROT|nr:SDR family oxidoreductase [Hwanghaeella grinnelliae]RVU38091.1 SDR family oxidoreductase [Hwanghaeella grinnelliae]
MIFDLTGKTALITGSSRGIGRAIAEAMGGLGANVVISSRTAEDCDKTAAELKATGISAASIPCHIGRNEELQSLVDKTRDAFGQVDILVCNAAINPVYGPLAEVSDEAFDKIMTTNVRSAFTLCKMVLPDMAKRGEGSIIVISSIAGLYGNDRIGAYGVSKAAEAQLVRNLAVEWGPKNIRVNAISPGLIKTDFARALWEDPEVRSRSERKAPLHRIGEPEEIGGLAAFLASPAASFITGQNIVADGGQTISGGA